MKNSPVLGREKEMNQKPAEQVAVDGFNQVLEMLKIADPAFRESLLTRLANKDRDLARSLRKDLANLGL